MVSVNYNMKINTKRTKDKCLESKQRIRISYEDSICRGNYRTSQGILLLRKHDLGWCHREIKRRIATTASIWFEIWGSWIRVKISICIQPDFRKISIYSGNFTKEYRVFQANFRKFWFFQAVKKIDFPSKKCPFTAISGQIILFLFKSNHFRTYFLYMIRYRA